MSFGKAKKQNNKIHIGSRAFDVFLIVFMIIVAIIFLYPFLNVIATSLSSNRMITTGQVTFFPKEFHLDGYKALFKDENILGAYWNTIVIAVGTMIVSLVLNSYGLRYDGTGIRTEKTIVHYPADHYVFQWWYSSCLPVDSESGLV